MPTLPNISQATTGIADLLVSDGVLTRAKLDQATAAAQSAGVPLLDYLEGQNVVREEDLARVKATYYNVPQVELFGRMVRAEVLNIIPKELASNYSMTCFEKSGDEISIAMVDPANYKALEAVEFIARKNHYRVKYFITSKAGLAAIIKQYESLSAEVEEALQGAEIEAKANAPELSLEEEGFQEVLRQAPVSKMVSVILRHAVEGRASDVHIEPVGNETRVRYRVDGILHTSIILPKNVHSAIVARIKVLSNLKIDETRVPQDGRFRLTLEEHDIDFRISTLPLINNEKVVMRILDTATGVYRLEELGFEGLTLEAMRQGISKSHGMFLITGPTGSGKSTTLYALMSIMNKEGVNIVTLEDPVEYFMKGVNQSQVNPEVGLTFAAGLRSILRQDPDIIMVGEIRDKETAELGVHAALTGHIVLSTLHTNDAFGAIPRMIDMGIEPFLLASSINLVMAQRLVRRICQHCTMEFQLEAGIEEEVRRELGALPKASLPKDVQADAKTFTFRRGRGCARCENTGYKGRLAIGEVILVTEEIKKILSAKGNLIELIHTEFEKQGMMSMKQDGIVKAMRGLTTIEEVFDATRA